MLTNSNELLGQTLGTCTLQRLLGRGGMGAVYLARQSRPRRIVAVKVLLPGLLEERSREEFLIRFRREADAIAALDHIHIMPVYEYSEQGDTAYLVMPYVTGGTLRDRLEKRRALSLEESIQIIEQAAAGLNCAHAQGIIHRDLKPGNILFHADGRLLLADFGLAKVLKDVEDSGLAVLTSLGTIVGTPEYLSPEQGTGNPLDVRSDVYSLGVVLYHMLSGRVPFTGPSPVAIAIKHAMVPPPLITEFNPSISRSVEAVVMKSLAKSPDQRFSTAEELAQALRQAACDGQSGHLWQMPSIGHAITSDIQPLLSTEDLPTRREIERLPVQTLEAETRPEPVDRTPVLPDMLAMRKQVSTIPTMLMRPEDEEEDPHEARTEENPQLLRQDHFAAEIPPTPLFIPVESTPVVPPPDIPEKPVYKNDLQNNQKSQAKPWMKRQPARTVILISVLLLAILTGSFVSYLSLQTNANGQNHPNREHLQTAVAGKPQPTMGPVVTPTPEPAQAVAIQPAISAGPQLYGTNFSAKCDNQGEKWNSQSAHMDCTSDGAHLTNNGSSTYGGALLEQLPNGAAMPANFVLQAQVTINPNSSGDFGLFFRSQPGSPQNNVVFVIHPGATTWGVLEYNNGSYSQITGTTTLLPASTQTITIDLQVSGQNYNIYLNGKDLGFNANTSGSFYTATAIGLAVGQGADVTFKNLAIYSQP